VHVNLVGILKMRINMGLLFINVFMHEEIAC